MDLALLVGLLNGQMDFIKYYSYDPKLPKYSIGMDVKFFSSFLRGELQIFAQRERKQMLMLYLSGSSPPSPVFDLPPILFMAMASVVCASREILPKDMAPVANLFTILAAGST